MKALLITCALIALAMLALFSVAWLVKRARKTAAKAQTGTETDAEERERQRLAAEEEAKRAAEEERLREERAAVEAKARKEAQIKAEAEARAQAVDEAKARAEAEEHERQHLAAEAEAKRIAEEDRMRVERSAAEARAREEARVKAEAEAKARAEAEAKARIEAEERERQRLAAEEEARRAAEEERLREERAAVEAKAREEAQGKAKADAKAQADAIGKSKPEAKGSECPASAPEAGGSAESKQECEAEARGGSEISEEEGADEGAKEYRPPVVRPSKPCEPHPTVGQTSGGVPGRSQPFEVRLQLLFDRHGFVTINLLAARPANCGEELEGNLRKRAVHLVAVGDEWLQVEQVGDLAPVLKNEILLHCTLPGNGKCRWLLSKRSVFVLAPERGLAGFVSTPRLRIGYEQVVLCRDEMAGAVSAVLSMAGCEPLACCGQDLGVPQGWALFKSVLPKTAVPQGGDGDILNILRPLPEIEIQLEGGVRVENTTWLAGFPPEIRVAGTIPLDSVMQIDTKPAERLADGRFVASGYDAPGSHSIFIGGKSATYRIQAYESEWQPWGAHDYGRGDICGALAKAPTGHVERLITVPSTNAVLVGATPGEIFFCSRRHGSQWAGAVPFEPSWALPGAPLHCDKRSITVILLKPQPVVSIPTRSVGRSRKPHALLNWCTAIGDCRRKGLRVIPADTETLTLWRSYYQAAREIRRMLK